MFRNTRLALVALCFLAAGAARADDSRVVMFPDVVDADVSVELGMDPVEVRFRHKPARIFIRRTVIAALSGDGPWMDLLNAEQRGPWIEVPAAMHVIIPHDVDATRPVKVESKWAVPAENGYQPAGFWKGLLQQCRDAKTIPAAPGHPFTPCYLYVKTIEVRTISDRDRPGQVMTLHFEGGC